MVLVVKDIILIFRKNETILILISLKRYFRIMKNQYLKIYELIKIKYFQASKILSLMQFSITYVILIKEMIKHL